MTNNAQKTRHLHIVRPYISEEAEQLAHTHQLGQVIAEHRTRFSLVKAVYSGLCLLLALFLLAVMLMTEAREGQAIALVCALCFLGLGLAAPIHWLRRHSWHVVACTDGFLLSRGSNVDTFRWGQVEAIWQRVVKQYYRGIYAGATHKYRIQCSNGKRAVLDDTFANIEKFGTMIGREVSQHLLPNAIDIYNRGDAVTFGKISVDSRGVHDGRKLLAWNQIKDVVFSDGAVTFRQHGKAVVWSSAKVGRIPNILVFMGLVDNVLGRQRFGTSVSR